MDIFDEKGSSLDFTKEEDQYISPFRFVEEGEDGAVDAISFIQKDVNTVNQFAITRLTAGGKYVRGDLLFYSFNGIEIYTDIDNIIFVNRESKKLFIRQDQKVSAEINPKNPEEKQYIILYTDLGWDSVSDEEEFPLRWESVIGRTNAYNNIKDNADVIDIDKSIVLVETVQVKDSLTVREFMNYIKNSEIIIDESFDINDYTGGEYI